MQTQIQLMLNQTPKFRSIINRIYTHPASIIVITGDWKTGKTDFALWIFELLRQLGYVSKCASNIEIYKDYQHNERIDEPVKLIESMTDLKVWVQEYGRKLFIYDEAIESSPSRDAMTTLNKAWLKFIPQLSKTHTHLLVLTQEQALIDSIFKNPTFSWGFWRKATKKIAIFRSEKLRIKKYVLKDVPPTHIIFDPDKIATFNQDTSSKNFNMMPRTLQVATMLMNYRTQGQIEQALSIDRTGIRREMRKICRILVSLCQQPTEGKEIAKLCHEDEPKDH